MLFTEAGVTGLVRGQRPRLLGVGALSGAAVTVMPVALFIAMALVFMVLQVVRGESLLHPMGGFMGNLKAVAVYLKGVWPYSFLMAGVFAVQTLLARAFQKRGKAFEIATGGKFNTEYFRVGYDGVLFAVAFVSLVPFLLPELGTLLSYMGSFYYFTGAVLYIMWAATFEFLMHRVGVLSRREMQLISLSQLFATHDWLDGCSIMPDVNADGTVAVLTGHVGRKDQLSIVESAARMVEGIGAVDVSGLEIRRVHDKPFKHQRMY